MAMARELLTLWLRRPAFIIIQLCLTALIANAITDSTHLPYTTYTYTTTTSLTTLPPIRPLVPTTTATSPSLGTPTKPAKKPGLITDYEFEHLWNPDMDTLRVGVILEFNTPAHQRIATITRKSLSAIRMAVRDVNEQQIIPGLNMSLVLRDSQEPSLRTDSGGAAAIAGAGKLIALKVGAVVGDVRSTLTHYEALMTSSVNIPQCSFGSISPTLSDSVTYPYFFRTIPSTLIVLSSLLEVVRAQGWHRITIMYEVETLGYLGLNRLREIVDSKGIYVLDYIPLATPGEKFDPNFSEIERLIRQSDSRIQVVLSTGPEQMLLLRRMNSLGYFDSKHVWLTLNDLQEDLVQEPDPESYDGLIMINSNVELNGYGPYDVFKKEWMALNSTEYPGAGDNVLESNEAFAYTCITMLANMYAKIIQANITDPRDISSNNPFIKELKQGRHTSQIKVTDFYRNESFIGPVGPIQVDRNGDRLNGNYLISSVQNGRSVQVGEVRYGTYTPTVVPMPFRRGYGLPDDSAPWTIQNMRWTRAPGTIFGAFCIAGLAMTVATAIMVVYFRDHIVIKASSPVFCICELLGILLLYLWCCLYINIPTTQVCRARHFLPTAATTLLAGALVVKNYRIYRIFNSITVANQTLQTRYLLVYVIAAVSISLVPIIIQEIINPSKPDIVNIRDIQWATCAPTKGSKIPWYLGTAVIPTLVVLFGVFLAFSTRNVVFLWNEARQIAWVLYNSFFLLVVIIIVQTFARELYMAAYYITVVVSYFGATFALLVLFLPKIIAIWVSMREERLKNTMGEAWESHPHRENFFPKPGGIVTDLRLPGGGGFGGQYPDMGLLGSRFGVLCHGGHSSRTFYSSGSSSTGHEKLILKDNPQNNGIAPSGYIWGPASEHPLSPPPLGSPPGPVVNTGPNVASVSSTSNFEKIQTVPEIVSSAYISPTRPQSQRVDSMPSLKSLKELSPADNGNPLNAWMSAQLPHKSDPNKPFFSPIGGAIHKKSIDSSVSGGKDSLEISQLQHSSRREQEMIREGESKFQPIQADDGLEPRTEEQHDAMPSRPSQVGASKVLQSYCLLLPIRREGTWLTGFLSHWSMATLIVTPEVRSFLAVDSANGRSRSYLMLSMNQIHTVKDPTLRITTVDSGSVLIRFSNQDDLEVWRSLFSVSNRGGPIANTSNIHDSPVSRTAEFSVAPQIVNNGGVHLGSNGSNPQEPSTGIRPLEPAWTSSYKHGSILNRSTHHGIWRASRPDKINTHLPPTSEVSETEMGPEPWSEPPEPDNVQGQQLSVGASLTTTLPTPELQGRQQSRFPSNSLNGQRDITTTITPTPSASTASTPMTSPSLFEQPSSPLWEHPEAQTPALSQTAVPGVADEDDDDEDLYDPEFGFGSGSKGRRRYHRRCLAPSCTLQRSAVCKTSTPGISDSPSRPSTARSSVEIPSAAVLSTAATAVSAGWSEIDALSMAMVDPTGSFLKDNVAGPLRDGMGRKGCSKRGGSSSTTTSTTTSSASSFASTSTSSRGSRPGNSLRLTGLRVFGSGGSNSSSRQPSIDELNRGTRL